MMWSRAILIAAALLVVSIGAFWWFFARPMRLDFPASPDTLAGEDEAPPPAEPRAPPLPMPKLTVSVAGDAGVEVKRRGATSITGCASEGTAEPLCPGQYEVRASAPGQVGFAVVRLEPGDVKRVEVKLQPAAKLEVLVRDAEKLPVDRVNVFAQSPATGQVLKGRTDSDGTLMFEPVTPGEWWVSAQRDGFGPGAGTASTGKRLDLELGAVGVLTGALEPPASGVKLQLLTPERALVEQIVTDGGTFALGLLPHGKYLLRAQSNDFEPHVEEVTVPATGLTVRLSSGATVKGDLVGPARERLDGEVTASGAGPARQVAARGGAFEVRGLSAGRWTLSSGAGATTVDVDGGVSRVELSVPRWDGVIAGTCELDGGHRLPAEVTVTASLEGGSGTAATTCDGGTFELSGLQRGFWTLAVEAREGAERWQAVVGSTSTGMRDVRLVVPGVGRVTYRLVDEAGVTLETEEREHYEERDVELTLSAPKHVAVQRTVSLHRGADTALGAVRLQPGATVKGRVLDAATKDPIAGARVSLGGVEHETGADGTFSVREAAEGDVELTFGHPRYAPKTMRATAPGELAVELEPAARAVGTLITVLGAPPPPKLDVWAVSEKGSELVPVEGGHFVTRHLADGHWLLRVVGEGASSWDTVALDLKGAGDRTVTLLERGAGVSFEVEVTDRDGAPMPSDVLLVPRAADAPANEQELQKLLQKPGLLGDATHVAARYRFVSVPPGAYTALASARGRVWTVAVPVVVKAGMNPVRVAYPYVPFSR